MASKRPDIDWNAVQALYRADQISTREIARRYHVTEGAIRVRATKEGWAKDLGHKVAIGVKDAVLRSNYAKSTTQTKKGKDRVTTEKAVVNAAIQEGKAVVLRHQTLGNILAGNSQTIAEVIRDQIATVRAALEAEAPEDLTPKEQFLREVALTNRLALLAKAHDSLARASVNAVAIERQSRGLDDQVLDPAVPTAISITYYRQDNVLKLTHNGKEPPHEISNL